MRYMVRCQFLGSLFHGTQIQPKDVTVQGEFEKALSYIYDRPVKTIISSRLDAGVHALDFAVAFDAEEDDIGQERVEYYLKRRFFDRINILAVREVPSTFSPRFDSESKTYLYLIQKREDRNPLFDPFSFTPVKTPSLKKLKEIGDMFVGRHDFRYFSTKDEEDENTILTIDSFSIGEEHGFIAIRFTGKSFLKYQVRFLIGSMLMHDEGKLTVGDIENALDRKKEIYKYKAPAHGLILEKVHFPGYIEALYK